MDPSKMKVVDLRSELGALGLDTKGNKATLVDRLKKALETKTGKVFADTTILDTTTEDVDDTTPRKPGPASRTIRRSSSSRMVSTPMKQSRDDPGEFLEEDIKEESEEFTSPDLCKNDEEKREETKDVYYVDDNSKSPIMIEDDGDDQVNMNNTDENESQDESNPSTNPVHDERDQDKMEHDGGDRDKARRRDSDQRRDRDRDRELTEEEEWALLNERLKIREQERVEREKKQAEEDAKRLEEISKDPVKLQRLKRKQEKKARWSNFYKTVAVTNEVLTPPVEEEMKLLNKKIETETKPPEPEINDERITLSWYDSDLNQYLELPDLNSVVPLTEGALAYAWAGSRATHGVDSGRVCFEVRVGAVVTTTETSEKEVITNGLRVGWSSEDSTLHLGEGELSWAYESTGRAVNKGEYKEYGKQYSEKDVIGAYVDLQSNPCKISYTLNGIELGVAYEFDKETLGDKPIYPHVLTKNTCYKINLGYERYNMLTRTKIGRNRVEIPIEQIIEEKKAREAEIKRQKEEVIRRNRERKEKERKEKEERQRKKKEEREKIAREKKEKEAQEKKERGEEDPEEDEGKDPEKEAIVDKEKETPAEEQPKENGDSVVKPEPMETEQALESTKDEEKEKEVVIDKEGEKQTQVVKEEPANDDVKEVPEEDAFRGLLDKRVKNVIRYVVDEELDGTEACLVPGYVLIALANLISGPRPPATVAECEVIIMVGMPGSGKTYWAKHHAAANPAKRYNILSTGALFDKMKVDCKPFRATYEGRWDAMVTKSAKCVLKLLEIAKGRRRNFILDQTNVYPSAQRRKLREFDGYRRVAVVIVTDEETYKERQKRREEADGKEVPDGAIVDMKANFSLPEKGAWLDDVLYPELDEDEARKVVETFHKEAKAAGVVKEREKRERSASRDGPPPSKRPRDDKRHGRDDRRGQRDFGRDREERWGGGGGGGGRGGGGGGGGAGRWGPAARGGRWGGGGGGGSGGGRDRGGGMHAPQGRFDRSWGQQHNNRNNDFGGRNEHRDNFRGGRGGHGGPNHGPGGPGGSHGGGGGPSGPGGPGGPGMRNDRPRGPPPPVNEGSRFNRDRPPHRGPPLDKRQGPGGNLGGSGGGGNLGGNTGGSGMGSWQRGGAPAQQGTNRGPPRGPQGSSGLQNMQNSAQGGQGNQGTVSTQRPQGNKEISNQNQNQNQNQNSQNSNQPGWNQWASGWGGWGNWNQNQAGWGNWGNWGWGNPQSGGGNQSNTGGQGQGGGGGGVGGSSGNKGNQGQNQNQNQNQQWPNNYTAQQWYQWQQWQQQQQGWPGYQQSQGNQQSGNMDPQAWAQYYQNYGGANSGAVTGVPPPSDKK